MITNNSIKNSNTQELFIKFKTNDDKWFVLDAPLTPYFSEINSYIQSNIYLPFSYDILTTLRSYCLLINDPEFKVPEKIIYNKLDIMYQALTEVTFNKRNHLTNQRLLIDVFILSLKLNMKTITRIIASFLWKIYSLS